MDWASSSIRSVWKIRLGCRGFAAIESIGSWVTSSPACDGSAEGGVVGRVGSRAVSPLPSARRGLSTFLFTCEDLLRETDITLGAPGAEIVSQDGHTVAGRLGQANAPRNDRFEDLVAEEVFEVGRDLTGQIGAIVEHRQ